jgi:drug/metabolite transporter (DMT)-like permease
MSILAEYRGELAALVGSLLWAVASVVYSDIGRYIPPRELNLAKGLLALAMLGLTILAVGDPLPSSEPLALGLLLVSGAIGIGLGDTAFFASLKLVGARRVLLLGMLAPPLAALIALLFMEEALSPAAWLGMGLTVLGVAWVVTERVPEASQGSEHLALGILLGCLAALAQASAAVLAHAALAHTSISPLWGTAVRLAAGVALLMIWISVARQPLGRWTSLEKPGQLWGRLLFALFTGTYLSMWLHQVALKLAPAGIAQTLYSTSPLFVLPLAAWTGERITVRAALGAIVALVGIGLLFGPLS